MRPCYKCDYFGGFRQGLLSKIELPYSREEAISRLENHLNKYKIYEHKNASNEPLILDNRRRGIKEYI